MTGKNKYYFDEKNRFVIENYNHAKSFSSFLPGIAGKKGIPMWVFYVNRGQCITSFGINNKDNPIMEFFPAFRSYQNVETLGFRTFIKIDGRRIYEPFVSDNTDKTIQVMHIGMNELELCEKSRNTGIETNVLYYTLPLEKVAALIRKTKIKNVSNDLKNLEILDGMPALLPYGINDYGIKHVGNTLKAWMDVYNLESKIPIFKLRSTAEDTVDVSEFEEGHFYLSLQSFNGREELLTTIVDPNLIFGLRTSMNFPEVFSQKPLDEIIEKKQITSNKIPCAFSTAQVQLKPKEEMVLYSVIGHAIDISIIDEYKKKFSNKTYFIKKYDEGNEIISDITKDIYTQTSSKLFDKFCQQNYLDNVLRGGYPLVFSKGKRVYHVYSRKHGDLERDYNSFVLSPEYYSSGNGSYRDVNQNRREDLFYNSEIERYNIKFFINLIQTDGYNPLVINGVKYRAQIEKLGFLDELLGDTYAIEELKNYLSTDSFTPGKVVSFIEKKNLKLKVEEDEFLRKVIEVSEEEIDAVHGEGFWTDHWTYNLDMIENYLEIYPENKKELLFDDYDYTYYDNEMVVLPRNRRNVLVDEENKKIRQYNSLIEDQEKKKLIESRETYKHVMREKHGNGQIFSTNLITKLINIAAIKFATLDPCGMGIEMEAGKPGWYDALNGLPGLFGSSVADAFELSRLFVFLVDTLKEFPDQELYLPVEVISLINDLVKCIEDYESSSNNNKDYHFWESISDLRERYREETRLGFEGKEINRKSSELSRILNKFNKKLLAGLSKSIEDNDGIMPTYFYYVPKEFEIIDEIEENTKKNVKILGFSQKKMPLFLEGVVRGFKIFNDEEYLKKVYKKVKKSDLFDKKLKMYKVNGPLDNETIEIGRAKAFTPGWLENESIWLHMEYKYILEVLKSGLYEEFYEDFRNVLVPFLSPEVYGRSPLENSSFIASSSNPDETIHGTGFVARLSGSTAEFLSIWKLMFVGNKPFTYENGQLVLRFKPILPGWLFDEKGKVTFNFQGKCKVTYYNPDKINTFDAKKSDISKWKTIVYNSNGDNIEFPDNKVYEPYSKLVRDGKIKKIDIHIKN
ncbi:MAG: cellobiose phosphorylase [Kosmotoga sp.]|nr:MAG: cellobiose phosphorylase [Kosmotoga sp.]